MSCTTYGCNVAWTVGIVAGWIAMLWVADVVGRAFVRWVRRR